MDKLKTYISEEWLVDNHFYFTAKYFTVAYTNGKIDLVRCNDGYVLVLKIFKGYPVYSEKVRYVEDLNKLIIDENIDHPKLSTEKRKTKTYTEEEVYRIVANFSLEVNTDSLCGGYGTTTEIVKELKKSGILNFSTEEKSNI